MTDNIRHTEIIISSVRLARVRLDKMIDVRGEHEKVTISAYDSLKRILIFFFS